MALEWGVFYLVELKHSSLFYFALKSHPFAKILTVTFIKIPVKLFLSVTNVLSKETG